jgi:hypothetical protein
MSNVRSEIHTTTIRLPLPVYEQAKCVVAKERGASTGTISINDFIVNAIKAYLKMIKRRQIDAAFAGMAEDADYQKEATLLAEDFEHSDWEALRLEEVDLEGEALEYAASSTR